jgi:aspartate/methionine/tyrosine aminotransferase
MITMPLGRSGFNIHGRARTMKRFAPSIRMLGVSMPPIGRVMGRLAEMRAEGKRVFGMAQAVPWFNPPESALAALSHRMDDPRIHRYSPDPGFPEVRRVVAGDFRVRRSIDLDPDEELHLTCGASQAFLSVLLTATSPGDTVAVVEPYYFDHVFAIGFSGLRLVSIPMEASEGEWHTPVDRIERILPEVAALVLVNPGNPTGAVIPDQDLQRLAEAAERCGTFLILDETYERFSFTSDHWHPWMGSHSPGILTIGSFSKSLGMPGWRLGYLFGDRELLEQAIKVQDSVAICPPCPAQFLLEAALPEKDWILLMSDGIRRRRDLCREALLGGGSGNLEWRQSDGAFFTLVAYPGGMPSEEAALHVLEEYGIGTIPGAAFGSAGEGHLRVSFGCLAEEELLPAMEILGSVRIPVGG